jgi:hypothetical protein
MHDLPFLKANGLRGLVQAQVSAAGADSATTSLTGHIAAGGALLVATAATDQFLSGAPVPLASTVAELQKNASALNFIMLGINEAVSIIQANPGTIADPTISSDPLLKVGYPPHRSQSRVQPSQKSHK